MFQELKNQNEISKNILCYRVSKMLKAFEAKYQAFPDV